MIVLRAPLRKRAGLTLVELVVVLVILAALAAMLIPRLGYVKDTADTVTSASGSAELANNLEIYKASTGLYPLRMDSLIKGDGSGVYDRFWASSGAAAPTWLAMENLTAGTDGYWYSIVRAGITSVADHDAYVALSDPSASGNTVRDYQTDGKTAVVVTTGTTGARIMQAAGFTTAADLTAVNGKLVAFGIGPKCGLVGQTMANVPRHSAAEQDQYGRYLAIFAAYNNGFGAATKAAQLRCVVDSRGFPVDYRLNQYKLTAPTQE